MAPDATDEDIAAVVARVEEVGGEAFVSRGLVRTIIGLVGDIDSFHHLNLRALHGVADVRRISDPYKLVSRQHHPERSTVWVGPQRPPGPDRPGHLHLHRRPVRGREPRADLRGRRDGPDGRRDAAARRRLQAAHLALRLPGSRRRGAGDPRRRPRRDRAPGRHRGRRRPRRTRRRRARRHAPGRDPQHGQLRPAPGGRRGGQAGPPQARHDRDRRGVADGRRVHRPARQPRRRPVRARHPHLRAGDPQHPRHLGGPGRPGDQPPADHRRPVARGGPQGPGRPAVPSGHRGRCGRRHRRRAPPAGDRAVRRSPGARRLRPARARPGGQAAPAGRGTCRRGVARSA